MLEHWSEIRSIFTKNIQEGNAAVNRAVAAVESVDVIRTELGNEVVDDLFNRLYSFCGNNIKFCKSLIRIIQHLCDWLLPSTASS